MNIALEKTEEYVNGQKRRTYGDAFVRGNNGSLHPALSPDPLKRRRMLRQVIALQSCTSPQTRRVGRADDTTGFFSVWARDSRACPGAWEASMAQRAPSPHCRALAPRTSVRGSPGDELRASGALVCAA